MSTEPEPKLLFWKDDRIIAVVAQDGKDRWQAWLRWGDTFEPTGMGTGYATYVEALESIGETE